MKHRDTVWANPSGYGGRNHVFERQLGQRNYLVGGDFTDARTVICAISDLVNEMKQHVDERNQLNVEIERLKKFGVTGNAKVEEREKKLKQDFESYASSVIELLARAGIASESNFKITPEEIKKSPLSEQEKKEVKAFVHAVMTLYPQRVTEFRGTVTQAKERVNKAFGMADPAGEKKLLTELQYKKQAIAVGSQLNKGTAMFADKSQDRAQRQEQLRHLGEHRPLPSKKIR